MTLNGYAGRDAFRQGIICIILAFAFLHFPEPALPAVLSAQPPSQAVAPGSSCILRLVFASEETPVSSLQFDLEFDGAAISLGMTAGAVARNSGKAIHVSNIAPGRKRFLVAGVNRQHLTDGGILELFANIRETASQGRYALRFSGLTASSPDGQSVPFGAVDGVISVEGGTAEATPLRLEGVLNGASLLAGPVAPGEAVTLIGSGIGPAEPAASAPGASQTDLRGARVSFNGVPAVLLYAAADQINAVAPEAISGSAYAILSVQFGNRRAQLEVPVVEASPALFTIDSSGSGQGVILNQDSSVNSRDHPASRDSLISLFASGAGIMKTLQTDALPTPELPVSAQIGGVDAPVLRAVAVNAGVIQITCRVPSVDPGHAISVAIQFGSARSPAGVTIAIE
jgi:uncharacterized protein (TIGR03437 family)